MSSFLTGGLSFLDKYVIGYALGTAAGPALSPFVQDLENTAWTLNPVRPPEAVLLAEGVAQGQVDPADAYKWAEETGFGRKQMDALVNIANVGPALGYAFEAWRRGFLTDTEFETALRRTGLEEQWYPALKRLKTRLVDLPNLAAGIQRGLIEAPFPLPYTPPGEGGRIPAFPTSSIDAAATTEGLGYTLDELFLETALAGNPPGPEALYRAKFRGAINDVDVQRGLAEGRARQEWAPAYEADARSIPSPTNYVEALVRNWISRDEMQAGVERHGMTPDDAQLLFLIHGRPLTHNQVFIGLLRGGVYDGPTDMIEPAFLKSLQESDMRPEWYNLAWHARFHFPPFFQTINALNKGWIDAATATQWLLWQAYDPDAVQTIVANVTGSKTASPDTHVKSAQTTLITAIRKAYLGGALDDAAATAQLQQAGLSTSAITGILEHWRQTKTLEASTPSVPVVQ